MPDEDEIDATEVRANFAFDIDIRDQSLTLWQEGKSITLSYWECLLLNRILDKQLNN
jgi:hypothetical protein